MHSEGSRLARKSRSQVAEADHEKGLAFQLELHFAGGIREPLTPGLGRNQYVETGREGEHEGEEVLGDGDAMGAAAIGGGDSAFGELFEGKRVYTRGSGLNPSERI